MKKTYKELDLISFRKKEDIDFCHYTYKRGQCSCCYGPSDLPSLYWKNRTIRKDRDVKYLLYKNANNGSGTRKGTDETNDIDFISWGNLDRTELEKICMDLSINYGEEYVILVPSSDWSTIIVLYKNYYQFSDYISHYFDGAYSKALCNGEDVSALYRKTA